MREVTRIVVSEVAPEEMVLFGMNSRAYFRDPARTLEEAAGDGGGSKESLMGAGGTEVVVMLTPFALARVQGVLSTFVGVFAANLADGGGTAVRRWLDGLCGRSDGETEAADPDSALTPDQVEWLREEAYRTLRRAKLGSHRPGCWPTPSPARPASAGDAETRRRGDAYATLPARTCRPVRAAQRRQVPLCPVEHVRLPGRTQPVQRSLNNTGPPHVLPGTGQATAPTTSWHHPGGSLCLVSTARSTPAWLSS
ncbi:hypothetical protein PUR53_05845 [Streptomyces sp. SP18BB07]|nr:hypothetical protein [Streptomyces sp. SP18BB07]